MTLVLEPKALHDQNVIVLLTDHVEIRNVKVLLTMPLASCGDGAGANGAT